MELFIGFGVIENNELFKVVGGITDPGLEFGKTADPIAGLRTLGVVPEEGGGNDAKLANDV
jgi:hypothetical protein